MRSKQRFQKRTTVALTDRQHRELWKQARDRNLSLADILRLAITNHLKREISKQEIANG
jgi:hypothetical protein